MTVRKREDVTPAAKPAGRVSRYGNSRQAAQSGAEKKSGGGFQGTSIIIPAGVNLFKIEAAGIRHVDLIPYEVSKKAAEFRCNPEGMPPEGGLWWERTYWLHARVGPGQDSYVCPWNTFGRKCAVCQNAERVAKGEARGDYKKAGDLLQSFKAKKRQLMLPRDLDADGKPINLWDYSYFLFGKFLDQKIAGSEERRRYHEFFYLEDGFELSISFTAKTMPGSTKPFYEVTNVDFDRREVPYDDSVLEGLPCLDELVVEPDYDEVYSLFVDGMAASKDRYEDPQPRDQSQAPATPQARQAAREVAAHTEARRQAPAPERNVSADGLSVEGIVSGDSVSHLQWGRCVVLSLDGRRLTIKDGKRVTHAVDATEVTPLETLPQPGPPARPGNRAGGNTSSGRSERPNGRPPAKPKEEDWDEQAADPDLPYDPE